MNTVPRALQRLDHHPLQIAWTDDDHHITYDTFRQLEQAGHAFLMGGNVHITGRGAEYVSRARAQGGAR